MECYSRIPRRIGHAIPVSIGDASIKIGDDSRVCFGTYSIFRGEDIGAYVGLGTLRQYVAPKKPDV